MQLSFPRACDIYHPPISACRRHGRIRLLAVTHNLCAHSLCYHEFGQAMNITLSVDKQIVARARKRAHVLGKSLNQIIREHLETLAGADDPQRSIDEFRQLSGKGHSSGWRFNRDEIHERS